MVRFKSPNEITLSNDNFVSIPLWFDSNNRIQNGTFCNISVSIPLWFDSNLERSKATIQHSWVSIPLWFDSNHRRQCHTRIRRWSQFHYGSIQIIALLQTITLKKWSQFHYGSIQIRLGALQYSRLALVSIPLWFDSNS